MDEVVLVDFRYKPTLKHNAQILRKRMTKEERHLWYDCLKYLPVTVKRQQMIGRYIVDFYIAQAKLVIELDGSQHYFDKGIQNDAQRDDYLRSLGISVLRYSNNEINTNFHYVCDDIRYRLGLSQ